MANNFLDKAKNWFSGKKEAEPEAVETAEAPVPVQPEKPAAPEAAQSVTGNDMMQARQHVHGEEDPNYYFWLKNDGLLRDEGVLFGMASDDPAPKLDVIRAYFDEKGSILKRKVAFLEQKLSDLATKTDKDEVSLTDAQREIEVIKANTKLPVNPLGKYVLFGVFIAIAILNFLIIQQHLELVWRGFSWLLSGGIFLFGMIAVYQEKSIFFNHDDEAGTEKEKPEKWKLWLQELGIPLAVIIFIGSTTYQVYPLAYQFGVLFMEAVFFLLFGKGIMRLYQQLFQIRRENRLLKDAHQKNTKRIEELEQKLETSRQRLKDQEEESIRLMDEKQSVTESLTEVEQKRETACRLFLSEFFLAVSARAN